jgi:histidinol phosphatase-like PHP family hydrolase
MNLKANYHTHTKLCGHAIGMSEDYIVEAIKNNFVEIGIQITSYSKEFHD